MKIKGCRFLGFFKVEGIVLWPFVFFASKVPAPRVENHERIHMAQIRRDGVIKFYATYLKEYFRGRKDGLTHDQAYRKISYESEAYAHDHDFQYLTSKTS